MMKFIILSAAEASAVRGLLSDGTAALDPRPLRDGTFVLPTAVLSDPAHVGHRQRLAALPQKTKPPVKFLTADEEEV